jgi:hypothetical protein
MTGPRTLRRSVSEMDDGLYEQLPAQFVADLAGGLLAADSKSPQARGRTATYRPGIGPFSEAAAIKLIMAELAQLWPDRYRLHQVNVAYSESTRQRCDLCLGRPATGTLAVEMKLLRLLGDNDKVNDNMLMHILSPYPQHRSALTDCRKLAASSIATEDDSDLRLRCRGVSDRTGHSRLRAACRRRDTTRATTRSQIQRAHTSSTRQRTNPRMGALAAPRKACGEELRIVRLAETTSTIVNVQTDVHH